MNSKLYVGNLPFDIETAELEEHFSGSGSVQTVKLVTDRDTGRKKGFGFVEMSSKEEAERAILNLNEKDFRGRSLTVNMAREESRRPMNNSRPSNNRRY